MNLKANFLYKTNKFR